MQPQTLTTDNIYLIIVAVIGGTVARVLTIREDYRQYPTFPNGYLNQLMFGFLASTIGAVAIPALMINNYTAVTFFGIAITQFQNIRRIELTSLQLLEDTEYTKRGNAYIDGISKTFEARNYISLLVSLAMAICMQTMIHRPLYLRIMVSFIIGFIVYWAVVHFTKGKQIGDIAAVKEGEITIKDNELFIDGFFVTNRIGIERGQKMIEEEGLAVVLYPKENHYRISLDNYGQRQAILFEITRALGVKRYHYTRKNYVDGRIAFIVVPIIRDIDTMIAVVENTPVLESTLKAHLFLKTKNKRR